MGLARLAGVAVERLHERVEASEHAWLFGRIPNAQLGEVQRRQIFFDAEGVAGERLSHCGEQLAVLQRDAGALREEPGRGRMLDQLRDRAVVELVEQHEGAFRPLPHGGRPVDDEEIGLAAGRNVLDGKRRPGGGDHGAPYRAANSRVADVEGEAEHALYLRPAKNAPMTAATSRGFSAIVQWPAPGK